MQFIVISHQLTEIYWSLLLGLFLGLTYDLIRFIRRLFVICIREEVIVFILDLFYMIFSGASYCIFLYAASNGRFRWFTALGLLFGFLLYRLLPSRIIYPPLMWIADKIRLTLSFILLPFKRVVCIFIKFIKRRYYVIKTEKIKDKLCNDVMLD